MKVPQFTTCCCGCTVETGSKILGWGGLVVYTLVSISNIVLISDANNANSDAAGYQISGLVGNILNLVLCILLLAGIYQRKPALMMVWIAFEIFAICFLAIVYFAYAIAIFVAAGALGIIPLIMFGLVIVVQTYLMLVVNSYRIQIKTEQSTTNYS